MKINLDQYLSNEESYLNIDGMGLDLNVDATAQTASAPSPTPYAVSIYNSHTATLNAILFGKDIYYLDEDFGSDSAITITNLQGSSTYAQLLAQSGTCPFTTSVIKIIATNASQANQTITYYAQDANGTLVGEPITAALYANPFQNDSGYSITMEISREINSNTYLSIPILAGGTITVVIAPQNKFVAARANTGQNTVKQYGRSGFIYGIPTSNSGMSPQLM